MNENLKNTVVGVSIPVFQSSCSVVKRMHLWRPILGSMIRSVIIVQSYMIQISCLGEVANIQANHHLDLILEFYTIGFVLLFLHQAMLGKGCTVGGPSLDLSLYSSHLWVGSLVWGVKSIFRLTIV